MKSLRCLLLLVGAAVLLQAEDRSNYHVSVALKPINKETDSLLYDKSEEELKSESDKELVMICIIIAVIFVLACASSVTMTVGRYCYLKKKFPNEKVSCIHLFCWWSKW